MGVCSGKQGELAKSPTRERHISLTQGILKFNGELENIKLSYPVKSCYLKIDIGGFHKSDTPVHIDLDGKHTWKRKIGFQMEVSEVDMIDRCLTFIVYSGMEQLESVHIPLYDIATGPQHYDYRIGKGRIVFDMMMSQILQIEISGETIKCLMNESIQEKAYTYTLKLVTRHMYFTSDHSEVFNNLAYSRNGSFTNLTELSNIHWKDQNDKPILLVEIPLNELYTSSLQICLWSMLKIADDHTPQRFSVKSLRYQPEQQQIDHTLFAEAYIALSQLIQVGSEYIDQNYRVYNTEIKKGMWLKGKMVGQLTSNIVTKLPMFLQQQIIGLRTETGVSLGNTIVATQNMKEISEIQTIFQKLNQIVFRLQAQNINANIKAQLTMDALTSANQLLQSVSNTHKDNTSRQFYYKTIEDLMRGQDTFIVIAEHLVAYVDKMDSHLREKYYEILNIVCTRGELRLNQLGYFDEIKTITKKQLALKQQICLNYHDFLYSTLNIVLSKVCQKAFQYQEKVFVERFMVIAFFRVPEFRQQFLQCLINTNDEPLIEWRGTEFSLEEQDSCSNKQVQAVFDWQNYFYNYLQVPNNAQLKTLTTEKDWQYEIKKRNLYFFCFLTEYCVYIKSIFEKDLLPWRFIPGYRSLIRVLLIEIKVREFFSEALVSAVTATMANNGLLNVLVMILFNKTNVYSSGKVIQTMELMNGCFALCPTMPTNFDYVFLLNGIKVVITQSDHAFCIAQCINFIYIHFLLFPIEFRKLLCDLILDNVFMLLLHWSKLVRNVCQVFLIYRVYHQFRNTKPQLTDEDQFNRQYSIVSKPKKMQSFYESRKQEKQLISDYIYLKYNRFITNLESAKSKLKQVNLKDNPSMLDRMRYKLQARTHDMGDLFQQNEQHNGRKLELSLNSPHKVRKSIIIQDDKQIYLQIAAQEYNDLMKQYTKWRQQNLSTQSQNGAGLSPEEKSQKYLEYPVPMIKIAQHFDQKEGRQD